MPRLCKDILNNWLLAKFQALLYIAAYRQRSCVQRDVQGEIRYPCYV